MASPAARAARPQGPRAPRRAAARALPRASPAPASERREHNDLIAARHLNDALQHRRIKPQRGGRIDDREQRGLPLQRFDVDPAGEARHFDAVANALAPEAVGVNRLVRQRQHLEQGVEMSNRGVNVDRFDGIAAPDMNGIESLPEPQEILIVAMIPRTAAAVTIERVRRAGHRAESHVFIADDYVSLRVARVQREALRRETDLRFDERGIEAHAVRPGIDVRAGLAEDRPGLVVEDIDADFLQYRERGSMNGFELVSRDELDGRKPRARLRRGRDRRDYTLAAASAATRRVLARAFIRHFAVPSSGARTVVADARGRH